MAKPLVVVESPAKAKTISKFLGDAYDVRASVGHVADLPSKGLAVDVDNGFKPTYELTDRGKQVVKELRAALKDASELYLATDEDREGEAISWHLLENLKPKIPVKRMVFHEITAAAIDHAVNNPRGIDYGLVDAAETRRILDRLYGYEVSPVLWRRVNRGLSAGRVQSPSIRLIVERERERIAFVSAGYWDIELTTATSPSFTADLVAVDGTRVATGKDFDSSGRASDNVVVLDEARARGLADGLDGADFRVRSVEEKPYRSRPQAPFTTSTLQQEGGRKLRLSSSQVMRVAQGLYERGYITYMRTDSVALSDEALQAVRAAVASEYGGQFLSPQPKQYTSKTRNAQEAHEAIRPSTPLRAPNQVAGELNGQELSLYRLIWQRTLASQMADATGTTVTVRLGAAAADGTDAEFSASGTTITFAGYRQVYVESHDEGDSDSEREALLPPLQLRRRGAGGVARTAGTRHLAAGALHRGLARQATRGARHRPSVDVGLDHPDGAGPRVRVEEGPGARSDVDRLRRRQSDGAALRRARRLRLHGPRRDRSRRHRQRRATEGPVAAVVLLRRRRAARSEEAGRGEPRRDRCGEDQHVPDRHRPRRRGGRRQARQVRPVREAW